MNQIEAMTEILHCMKTALDMVSNNFYVCLLNGHFHCFPKSHRSAAALSIIELDRSDIEYGLTSKQWSIIESKIRELRKEKKL